jgi:hypothetical protein
VGWSHSALFISGPDSITGTALERTGAAGYLTMAAIASFSMVALADSAINDLLPARFTSPLMNYRHIGFMALATALVIMGGVLAVISRQPLLLPSFLLPALFSVGVTWLDLYDRASHEPDAALHGRRVHRQRLRRAKRHRQLPARHAAAASAGHMRAARAHPLAPWARCAAATCRSTSAAGTGAWR